ncbi:hypothetical protein GCM10011609_87650 [Lentzea pudingi]|uniref:Uncharacterized protein n=1 Tax=Lentzea pudingi TaxID=1789439 RepID=A0ABQ2IUJ7_9PSEU|nr:hypothetical protein GCM10011609_87650 [Lentzea pudingi]
MLMRAGLADMAATEDGFLYCATEEAGSFLSSLEAPYLARLRERAEWLTSAYVHEGADVRIGMRRITQDWANSLDAAVSDDREDENR